MTISTINENGKVVLSSEFLNSNLATKTQKLQQEYLDKIYPMEKSGIRFHSLQNFLVGYFNTSLWQKMLNFFGISSQEKIVNQFVENCSHELSKISLDEAFEIQKLITLETIEKWQEECNLLYKILGKNEYENKSKIVQKIQDKNTLSYILKEKDPNETSQNIKQYQFALLISAIALYHKMKPSFDEVSSHRAIFKAQKEKNQLAVSQLNQAMTLTEVNELITLLK